MGEFKDVKTCIWQPLDIPYKSIAHLRIRTQSNNLRMAIETRWPWDVRQGSVDLELHSVSCASPRTFPWRRALLSRRGGFGKTITMRNFNGSTRTSTFPILEEPLYRHRPAQGGSASCHFAFACWTGGWCAFARCPLTRPLQPRGKSCCSTRSRAASSSS